jgi:hypothetical protein
MYFSYCLSIFDGNIFDLKNWYLFFIFWMYLIFMKTQKFQ